MWEDATFGQIKFTQDHGEALYRRSLYIFWRRIVGPTLFFDVANRQQCAVKTGAHEHAAARAGHAERRDLCRSGARPWTADDAGGRTG